MDDYVTHWINAFAGQNRIVDAATIAITNFGVPFLVLCVAAQWWSKADRRHVRHTAVAAGLSFLLGLALNQALLLFVHRVRPYDAGWTHLIVPPSADWSFPSDHATAAFAIAASFALQGLPGRSFLFLAGAVLIAGSRVFVGAHYASDVIGGAVTGIVAALIVRVAYREGTRLDRFAVGIL
ncbi:MAG: phosphatase PAP2 family protein [Pseudomonadota bacterium]|nr:phosphatase PAP2 family protein [Pseudomonadota bacterium]